MANDPDWLEAEHEEVLAERDALRAELSHWMGEASQAEAKRVAAVNLAKSAQALSDEVDRLASGYRELQAQLEALKGQKPSYWIETDEDGNDQCSDSCLADGEYDPFDHSRPLYSHPAPAAVQAFDAEHFAKICDDVANGLDGSMKRRTQTVAAAMEGAQLCAKAIRDAAQVNGGDA